jgi:hypothetical protein
MCTFKMVVTVMKIISKIHFANPNEMKREQEAVPGKPHLPSAYNGG